VTTVPDASHRPVSRALVIDAPAKVNLFLRVVGRRDDGYRELETLFQALSLADEVTVGISDYQAEPESGKDGVTLEVDGPDLGPHDANLTVRAAQGFRRATGFERPIHIRLTKRIPAGAGLGGGSSDAAGVLKCLASLAGVEDRETLHDIACELGSDVAFFLGDSPLALGRGRGEVLTPISALPEAHFVLGLPPVHVSTVEAYAELPAAMSATPRSFDSFSAQQWDGMVSLAENDFEDVVCERHEEVRVSLAALRSSGALMAQLSGSGAASFGVFPDRGRAERAAKELSERFGWPFVTTRTRRHLPRPTQVVDGG